MIDTPTTVVELINRTRDSYDELKQAIAAVPEELQTRAGTIGDWSVRDVIAHVGADERWMAGQLEALRAGEPPTAESCYGSDEPLPPGFHLATQDGRNAWQRERLRDLSLEDARAMASEAHARLLAVIRSFSDAELAGELTIADLGTIAWVRRPNAGESGWPLWQWLRGVTYQHYAEHTTALRALATRPASGEPNDNARAGGTL